MGNQTSKKPTIKGSGSSTDQTNGYPYPYQEPQSNIINNNNNNSTHSSKVSNLSKSSSAHKHISAPPLLTSNTNGAIKASPGHHHPTLNSNNNGHNASLGGMAVVSEHTQSQVQGQGYGRSSLDGNGRAFNPAQLLTTAPPSTATTSSPEASPSVLGAPSRLNLHKGQESSERLKALTMNGLPHNSNNNNNSSSTADSNSISNRNPSNLNQPSPPSHTHENHHRQSQQILPKQPQQEKQQQDQEQKQQEQQKQQKQDQQRCMTGTGSSSSNASRNGKDSKKAHSPLDAPTSPISANGPGGQYTHSTSIDHFNHIKNIMAQGNENAAISAAILANNASTTSLNGPDTRQQPSRPPLAQDNDRPAADVNTRTDDRPLDEATAISTLTSTLASTSTSEHENGMQGSGAKDEQMGKAAKTVPEAGTGVAATGVPSSSSSLTEDGNVQADGSEEPPSLPSPPPTVQEPSIPFAVTTPGTPILVRRSHLPPPLSIPGSYSSSARSPPLSPNAPKSSDLSPTSRLTFLGSIGGGGGSEKTSKGMDVDNMISRLLDAGYSGKIAKTICLRNNEIVHICQTAREIFLSQPALIELNAPVKIVGDIHGQYTDLLRLFEMCGFPPSANFLFMGDYVDRGKMSLETILLLFCYKIKYPENFFLLRGNHECANVTKVYGFYDECKRRASIKMWKAFVDTFNCLPLAAIVANKIFCVHGGLSPSLGTMDDIRALRRPTDVPDYGLLNDLLWSDPSDTAVDWEDNERGVSYCFGRSIIQKFLHKHDFDLVCRAHMVVEDGYEFFNERTLVTVFSAPNYCGEFDNFGAVMSVSEELLCSFELLKPIDQETARAQMQVLAATNGGWRENKQKLSVPDVDMYYGGIS
ncbi:hypothetical protein BGZ94_006527 [Podila epigama]|nr:hypothetical protein BGZ94_006527 [Podila epigama]